MTFSLLGGGEDGEDSGVGNVEISEIFEMQDAFFFGPVSFDRVWFGQNMH